MMWLGAGVQRPAAGPSLDGRPWARHLAGPRTLLLAGTLLARGAYASGEFGACGPNEGIEVSEIALSPAPPHTNTPLTVSILGSVPGAASRGLRASNITVEATIFFCRRFQDCMPVFNTARPLCSLLGQGMPSCADLRPGEAFNASSSWKLPLLMIRGSYNLILRFKGQAGEVPACYELRGQEVLASRFINIIRDHRDASVAFVIAASSSRAIGKYFPQLSGGVLPQITGFLLMGILIGPYCTNLVSRLHIFLIGNIINRVALAFIAGAAGAEIFVPELLDLLAPMALQVLFISGATLTFCASGLLLLSSYGVLSVPALALQPTLAARGAVALLVAALMTARSPASIIAVVSELKCGSTRAAKMAIGITVLSDVVVLILFSLCTEITHRAQEGGGIGPFVLAGVAYELFASMLLGLVTGCLLRLTLPPVTQAEDPDGLHSRSRTMDEDQFMFDPAKDERLPEVGKDGSAAKGCLARMVVPARGALLILILYGAFLLASEAKDWSGGRVRLEPLLACTVASCVCGHDKTRRERLLEALSFWTPHVLLPFFTLAGASLQLPGLGQVLPAAVTLVALRALGIAVGSATAGLVGNRTLGRKAVATREAVCCTWLTLLAQAGVTLGLVLEVQRNFVGAWARDFGTLVIGVVVLNQLLGPVLCRVGLRRIAEAEAATSRLESSGASSSEEDSPSSSEGEAGLSSYAKLTGQTR